MYHINLLDRYARRRQTRTMRVELPRRLLRPVTFLLVVVFCVVFVYGGRASAQIPAYTGPQTKLIIFADHGMADGEWAALFAALRKSLTGPVDGPPLVEDAVLIRGEESARRAPLQDGIAVYLEGDCTLEPPLPYAPRVVEGRLGWVPRVNGRIEPFVHVDCRLLVKMLGRLATRLSRERKETVMGEAIARVIVHEWIHYARQSAAHSNHGIEVPQFYIADLLADDSEFQIPKRMRRPNKSRL